MKRILRRRLLAAGAALAASLSLTAAQAQTGVSDDRVSLPEGPGSLQSIGDNALVTPNLGSMSYSVPIDVPAGFEAVTPNLALTYNSAAGGGLVGLGWDLPLPFIERMTNRGLPRYGDSDRFVANGGDELTALGGGAYRSRFEGGFVRYTWHAGAAGEDYWVAEQPDGTVLYYGADEAGAPVADARAEAPGGTFRYHLVAAQDRFGHVARYQYRFIDGLPYLDAIEYSFAGGQAGSRVAFGYEDREDVLTDARSGSLERMTQRLATVDVENGGARIWRYSLSYAPYAAAGGQSRLAGVRRVGLNDTAHPLAFDFGYSQALGADCQADCADPYLVDMGNLGVGLGTGDATLVDIDGDGLPDVVDTSRDGAHRFFMNVYGAPADHHFSAAQDSASGTRASHQLSSPYVQVLDANGDGRADLLNAATGQVLYNLGDGDWSDAQAVDTNGLPDFAEEFGGGDAELANIRFLDYDNDRLIDVIRSSGQATRILRNLGAEGFADDPNVEAIGSGFADSRLELADMNGDGLQDAVILAPGQITIRTHLGLGRWSAPRTIADLPFNEAQIDQVQLEDINGDSLDDLVLVSGTELRYALNRGGERFEAGEPINAAGGQALPDASAPGTTVLFADMNGSGSDDVVWITANGQVTYLELFPVRPNLLTRITNGLGMTTEVEYITAAAQRLADETPWAYTLPFPMIMVSSVDAFEAVGEQRLRTTYRYRDGFYDAAEKAVRGFGRVELLTEGDDSHEARVEIQTYDLGVEDPYLNGRLLQADVYTVRDGAPALLSSTVNEYADCALTGVPAVQPYPVRFTCLAATETLLLEGGAEADAVRTRTEQDHDGYGRVVATRELGVVSGCGDAERPDGTFGAPTGPECTGDERYTWTDYADPAANLEDRWILDVPTRTRQGALADGTGASETTYFYDGDAFVGLPAGQVRRGLLTRSMGRVDDGAELPLARSGYDAHGNVIETIHADAEPAGDAGHTRYTFDEAGLLVTRVAQHLVDAAGAPYALVADHTYSPAWGELATTTARPYLVRGGEAVTSPQLTRYTYDDLGRLTAVYVPGDDTPATTHSYDEGAPISQITSRTRSLPGLAAPDRESVRCLDGFGRAFQTRARVDGDRYEIDSHAVFSRAGVAVAQWRPQPAQGGDCTGTPPAGEAPTRSMLDGTGRLLAVDEGGLQTSAMAYRPLETWLYDGNDLDPAHPAADTPTVQARDGLGRVVRVTMDAGDGTLSTYTAFYDGQGALAGIIDPVGNLKTQVVDGLGRVIESTDGDRGTLRYTYNARGLVTSRTDAEGRRTLFAYDDLGRVTARWAEADPDGTRTAIAYDDPTLCETACDHTASEAVRRTFPAGSEQFTYDAQGTLTALVRTLHGARFEFDLTTDRLGAVRSVTLPDGTALDYTYDGAGRPTGIDGFVDSVTWERGPLVAAVQYANGVLAQRSHDRRNQLATLQIAGAAGARLMDLTYTYDNAGRLTALADGAALDGQPSLNARYTYDALNRLVQADLDPERPDFAETLTFGYDAARNLVRKSSSLGLASPAHVGTLSYGQNAGPHAVTSTESGLNLAYDAAGHLVQRGTLTLGWDHLGRLTRTRDGDGPETRYAYADDDTRVSALSDTHQHYMVSPNFEIMDGMALTYVLLGEQRVAVRESAAFAAQVLSDVAPAAGDATLTAAPDGVIDTGDAVVAVRISEGATFEGAAPSPVGQLLNSAARRLLIEGEARVTWHHADVRGDVVAVTGADGALVARRAFAPFGTERGESTGAGSRGYNDKHLDATGLTYMGSRYYDAYTGQFTAPDFLFERMDAGTTLAFVDQAVSTYTYAQNNPVTGYDPDGRIVQFFVRLFARIGQFFASLGAQAPAAPAQVSNVNAAPIHDNGQQGGEVNATPGGPDPEIGNTEGYQLKMLEKISFYIDADPFAADRAEAREYTAQLRKAYGPKRPNAAARRSPVQLQVADAGGQPQGANRPRPAAKPKSNVKLTVVAHDPGGQVVIDMSQPAPARRQQRGAQRAHQQAHAAPKSRVNVTVIKHSQRKHASL
ncbi:MAG: VCBS repeat-containing protein [Myxococcales bacterium]|nr:VCBS repeat-containing protein [Myxococcales bacterium]